ncbi:hypothetical protein LOTGIDRAFT_174541 [Lottia gigantea]|uniref:Uncharacterized protein n=1 Tax=Lottia gigantea TaxID=225164 RepID=V4AQQ0_LOTGI|nr:hypothetical protein LOTGIDRAFT_174541 [Lottia gigantea]ESO97155.1 hypothetical protein LOTGIDRAFT_174541 [Lottia gigantea]
MKPDTLVKKIIEAIETASPTVITFNGKKINITKKLIDKYKYCKVRDDIDFERINTNAKDGGFLPFLPLICAGLIAAVAGGTAANEDKASAVKAAKEHNLIMEKEAKKLALAKKKGSGVADILGKVKEFGKRFGEETKKTVKDGLNTIIARHGRNESQT